MRVTPAIEHLRARGTFTVPASKTLSHVLAVDSDGWGLPPSFLGVRGAQRVHGGARLRLDADLFVGVTARECVKALQARGRRLPIDVWVRLADEVLAGLEVLDVHHQLWACWDGSRAFGVDVDGAVVQFRSIEGVPAVIAVPPLDEGSNNADDWSPRVGAIGAAILSPEGTRAQEVATTLCWLLEAWPLSTARVRRQWDQRLTHPQLTAPLRAALDGALFGDTTLSQLRRQLREGAPCAAASTQRLASVFWCARGDALAARAREAEAAATWLPPRWQGGGLLVQVDQALEAAALLESCPVDPLVEPVPEAAEGPADIPLMPTRFLELLVERELPAGRTFVNNAVVLATMGLQPRYFMTEYGPPPAGSRLVLTLRHPVQREAAVELQATADAEACAVLTPARETRQQRQLLDSLTTSPNPREAAVESRRSRLEAFPTGVIDRTWHPPVLSVVAAPLMLLLTMWCARGPSPSLWWLLPGLLTTALAVASFRRIVESWRLGGGASALLFFAATAGALTQRQEPGWETHAVAPTFLWVALQCLRGALLTDTRNGRWLASSAWHRAGRLTETACHFCARYHPPDVRFTECQYGACRSPLLPRHTCLCDACFSLDCGALEKIRAARRAREEEQDDGPGSGLHIQ